MRIQNLFAVLANDLILNVYWILTDESFLDFSYWGQAQAYVYKHKPKTITELKRVVEEFNSSLTEDDIRKMLQNMRKRAELCLQVEGKHFEHLLKKKDNSTSDWFFDSFRFCMNFQWIVFDLSCFKQWIKSIM